MRSSYVARLLYWHDLSLRLVTVRPKFKAWSLPYWPFTTISAREQACKDFSWKFESTSHTLADLLLSAAPIESHVGAVVVSPIHRGYWLISKPACQDSPNACVTLALPLGIFEHVRLRASLWTNRMNHRHFRTSCPRKRVWRRRISDSAQSGAMASFESHLSSETVSYCV